ncbi:DUF4377 domain-containing protein [Mariniflexile sp.]|uniref:DUF4377 domain-containing protein n=1 Tax=Mariniflexile sp. TaxID=1979402 RepID=UPI003567AF54
MALLKIAITMLVLAVASTSCSSIKTSTYWVNSMKKECDAGAGKAQCIQVYKGTDLDKATWTNFYAPIEGFTFEAGYLQKIEVSETPINKANIPADASSIHYKLITILEKKADHRMALHDVWAVTHINNEAISASENVPTLEINITEMRVFGTDGCNNYTGSIKNITSDNIEFSALASTRKMCPNMQVSDKFNQALSKTTGFKRENLNLFLFDSHGNNLLSLKKVD